MLLLKRILVATDFGEAAANALTYGRELARRFDASLFVAHVVEDASARLAAASTLPFDVTRFQADLEQLERRRLEELVTDEDRRELRISTQLLVSTSPADELARYAASAGIDLIVSGTHGRGPVAHLLMGRVAERLVRIAPCPVLTVRYPEREFVHPDALQVLRTV
jgi:nucleotide-binding universal stress UspA family protein